MKELTEEQIKAANNAWNKKIDREAEDEPREAVKVIICAIAPHVQYAVSEAEPPSREDALKVWKETSYTYVRFEDALKNLFKGRADRIKALEAELSELKLRMVETRDERDAYLYARNKWHIVCDLLAIDAESSSVSSITDQMEALRDERNALKKELAALKTEPRYTAEQVKEAVHFVLRARYRRGLIEELKEKEGK